MHCSKTYSITSSASTEQRYRNCDAERLGGLEVDGQLDFCGLLHGQVSDFFQLWNYRFLQ